MKKIVFGLCLTVLFWACSVRHNPATTNQASSTLVTGWYYVVETDNGFKRQLDKTSSNYFINPIPIVVARNFTNFEFYQSNVDGKEFTGLSIQLDGEGTESWRIATENAIGRQLAFILDNRLLHVATVYSQITAGVTALNRSDYSKEELEKVKAALEKEQ